MLCKVKKQCKASRQPGFASAPVASAAASPHTLAPLRFIWWRLARVYGARESLVRLHGRPAAPFERRLLRRKGHASARTRCHVLCPMPQLHLKRRAVRDDPGGKFFLFLPLVKAGGKKKKKFA
jgi:hypothetical protein